MNISRSSPGNNTNDNSNNHQNQSTPDHKKKSSHIVKELRVQVYFKGGQTIKGLPVAPKDKGHFTEKWSNIQVHMWQGGML